MTVEIIKRGDLPGDPTHVVTCRHCKTEFRFNESDAREITDWRDGDYLEIACPVCNRNCTKGFGE